jgi:hypothetical protein
MEALMNLVSGAGERVAFFFFLPPSSCDLPRSDQQSSLPLHHRPRLLVPQRHLSSAQRDFCSGVAVAREAVAVGGAQSAAGARAPAMAATALYVFAGCVLAFL